MKNLIKGAFITVGILLLLGFILVGVGLLLGAGNSDNWTGVNIPQKMWNTTLNSRWHDDFFNEKDYTHIMQGNDQSAVIDSNEISNLVIDLGTVYLTIEESKDEDYHIKSSTEYKYGYDVSNDTLTIGGLQGYSNWIGVNNFNMTGFTDKITLQIPKDTNLDAIELIVAVGEVEIKELTADLIILTGGMGKIDISKIVVNDFNIEMGVGDLEIAEIDAVILDISGGMGLVEILDGNIEKGFFEVGMGETHFEGEVAEELRIEGGMGSIELVLEGLEEDYNFEVEGGLGNVKIGNNSYGFIGEGRTSKNNDIDKNIIIECGIGEMNIDFK